ncbi:YifB family Mg chelatase-like AAA ATPase [Trebonia sp.]|uniref:YifB family Mg chelatase-like AAA ATPase n=1 Tax=Trebonia sp. TaxID=2767075 RepID=UPI0026052DD8|nr:YifB family Mg chelatase-like AAA ATPase [Trebonia sp.]
MALARAHSVALVGVKGHLIEVEADIAQGLPATILVGLPDTALREARDRIRAAIVNSGEKWPQSKITVGLSPASLPKKGSGFDVAIAIAILAAASALPVSSPAGIMFLAELGLDGCLRPVPGVLPAVVAAMAGGLETVVVAVGNAAEAALVPGVRVITAGSLAEVAMWLRGGPAPAPASPPDQPGAAPAPEPAIGHKDLAEVLGQSEARKAVEICAAGGHNLSLLGPPGAGKTMLAERLPTILPRLEPAAALEVTSIHSVAGTLPDSGGLMTDPPFCAPHHTASKAAIVGGGSGIIRPGAASLAHRGVLFLDEAPEFQRDVLDALRQPLEAGEVVIARSAMCATFPARFTLVLAANPCPCAKSSSGGAGCGCSPATKRRYLGRLSGPLLDRVDVKVQLLPVNRREMLYDQRFIETSAVVAERVAAARERMARRLSGTPWRLNAEIPGAELRRSFAPQPGAVRPLERAMELGQVSARGADKIVRVAWSVADLAGKPRPCADEINVAVSLWLGVSR